MGQKFDFECRTCGYSEESSGGADFGMRCATQTVACTTCGELYDVVISTTPWDADSYSNDFSCPSVPEHEVAAWNHPGPCPRCGQALTRDERGPTLLWD